MTEREEPQLVVDVPWEVPWWLTPPAVMFAAALGGGLLIRATARGALPWVPDPLVGIASSPLGSSAARIGLALVAAVAVGALLHRLLRRTGRVELLDDRVVVVRGGELEALPFALVRGYRDGSIDHVAVVAFADPYELAIPTPTESDRTAVLAFLDARGLPRLDDA